MPIRTISHHKVQRCLGRRLLFTTSYTHAKQYTLLILPEIWFCPFRLFLVIFTSASIYIEFHGLFVSDCNKSIHPSIPIWIHTRKQLKEIDKSASTRKNLLSVSIVKVQYQIPEHTFAFITLRIKPHQSRFQCLLHVGKPCKLTSYTTTTHNTNYKCHSLLACSLTWLLEPVNLLYSRIRSTHRQCLW